MPIKKTKENLIKGGMLTDPYTKEALKARKKVP